MSKISLASNASGTGIFTLASPATNTNRTLTLPDSTGTLLDTNGGTITGTLTVTGVTTLGNGAVLGVPASGTATNLTGLPLTTGVTGTLPVANGGTNLTSFTSGGVVYASSASVLATGSALTFDGTNFAVGTQGEIRVYNTANTRYGRFVTTSDGTVLESFNGAGEPLILSAPQSSAYISFKVNAAEQMRLTSTGLGIGTSSPATLLEVYRNGANNTAGLRISNANTSGYSSALEFWTGFNGGKVNSLIYGQPNGLNGGDLIFQTRNQATDALVDRVTINNAGDVGIGTSSPIRPLQVGAHGSGNGEIALGASTTGYNSILFGDSSANFYQGYVQYQHNGDFMLFATAATERIRIDSSGNVGIGTSSPASSLQVNKASANPTIIATRTGSSATTLGDALYLRLNDSYGNSEMRTEIGMGYGVPGTQTYTPSVIGYVQTSGTANTYGDIYFATRNVTTDTAPTERVRITSAGNVGIGTSTPSRLLELSTFIAGAPTGTGFVGGALRLSNLTEYESNYGTGGGNPDFLGSIEFYAGDTSTGTGVRTAIKTTVDAYYNENSLCFYTAPVNTAGILERMRIDSSGKVGIGTTSPTFSNGKGIAILDGTTSRLKLATTATGSGATDGFELSCNGSEAYIYNYENSFMAFGTNATERMRIDSSGNLGIGTSITAVAKVNIQLAGTVISGSTTGVTMGAGAIFQLNNSNAGATNSTVMLLAGGTGDTTVGQISSGIGFSREDENTWGTQLRFYTHNSATDVLSTLNEQMRITSAGNVGIGTTSPSLLFQVSTRGGMSSDGVFQWGESLTGNNRGFLTWDTNTGVVGAPQNLDFSAGGSNRGRIDSSGNLLVGATAVGNGGKLYVNGSISLGTTALGTQTSMAKDTTQLTTSVSTSATTIYTDISSGMSSASAGYFIIYGHTNAGAGFMDVVISKPSGTPVVVSSSTVEGSPAARTYSVSSFALQLTMASGTYNVNLKATVLGYPF